MCLLGGVLHAWLLYVYKGDVCTASRLLVNMEVFQIVCTAMPRNGVVHGTSIKINK